MNQFHSIKELIRVLDREKDLLNDMFKKRKELSFKFDYALEFVQDKHERLHLLIEHNILRKNGDSLEIEDTFLDFFEQVLHVNEDLNLGTIDSHIEIVRQNIIYHLQEPEQYKHIRNIKITLRKIGQMTLRNIIDLKRNTENTFKNEPNYKIKKVKLQHLDQKRANIQQLIFQVQRLISEDESVFFKSAQDDELFQILTELNSVLNESEHNLLAIQTLIIEYLNQFKLQDDFLAKLKKIKYLRDQFLLQTNTNIDEILSSKHALIFDKKPTYPLNISLKQIQTDEAFEIIRKIAQKKSQPNIVIKQMAQNVDLTLLNSQEQSEIHLDLEKLKNNFIASGYHLFEFIQRYPFERNLDLGEKLTVYCQMISLYEQHFDVTENYNTFENIEYSVVFPRS